MKNRVEILLQDELEIQSALAYAIPLKWWQQFCITNFDIENIDALEIPEFNIRPYVDPFLMDYENYITEELEHKCNYLKFSRVFLSPQPKKNIQWKIVSTEFWKRIQKKNKRPQGVLVCYDKNNPEAWKQQEKVQTQIVFCSKAKSQAFIGYFPPKAKIAAIVRDIGYQLGFIEMQESKIMYPDKNHGRIFLFAELEETSLQNALDSLIMAYNLQKKEHNNHDQVTFNIESRHSSNEAVMGDLGMVTNQSWEQLRNDRTMSTGAETPTFVWSQEQNGQFRVKELFRQRKPEEIQQMKIYAQKCIKGELVQLPLLQQGQMSKQLKHISSQIIEHANMHKKKIHKDKQILEK